MEFASDRYAQLAIQGPKALTILQKLTPVDLAAIRYYWFTDGEVSGTPARIARTGYTGEDGFEIYVAPAEAARLWNEILEAGREFGIKPAAWARATRLRLEAKMALYGHEIDASISPLEADLGWIVKIDKGEFVGRARCKNRRPAACAANWSASKCAGAASGATVMKSASMAFRRVGSPAAAPRQR